MVLGGIESHRGMRGVRGIFFCQAEDGIRDLTVTGVQTCALPILNASGSSDRANSVRDVNVPMAASISAWQASGTGSLTSGHASDARVQARASAIGQIGRASCRERV